MQTDDVNWRLLSHGFCSFKTQTKMHKFCRNEYNLTGLCTKQSCPLSNSQYATVREEKGVLYLYMKVVERSHFPNRLWEKVKLSNSLERAIQQIEEHLIYWPKFIRYKCKQRIVRLHQVLVRMRKLVLYSKKTIVPISKRIERRELRREEKALTAAKIENCIEQELLNRLQKGTYGSIYNYHKGAFDRVLEKEKLDDKEEVELEDIVDDDPERVEYVEDFEESEDESDVEELTDKIASTTESESSDEEESKKNRRKGKGPRAKKPKFLFKKPHVEIEYEVETQPSTSRLTH